MLSKGPRKGSKYRETGKNAVRFDREPSSKVKRKEKRDDQAEIDELKSFSRGRIAAIVGLGVLGAFAAYHILKPDDGDKNSRYQLQDVKSSEFGGTEVRKRFDIQNYTPPPEGVIIGRHIISLDAKTVVYVADLHSLEAVTPGQKSLTQLAQKDEFEIMKAMISKYGKIYFAIENHHEGVTASDIKKIPQTDPVMRQLYSMENAAERKKYAEQVVGQVPTWDLLVAAYQDEIVPIGTVPHTREHYEQMEKRLQLQRIFFTTTSDVSKYLCVGEKKLAIGTAIDSFQARDRDDAVVECYCDYHNAEESIARSFEERKTVWAAREVEKALAASSDFVVVMAGALHIPGAIKEMQQQNVNYVIVVPGSGLSLISEKLNLQTLTEKVSGIPKKIFPDDAEGTCKKRPSKIQ